ncbi:3D domain-containing protein [Alkalihalobacillus pseudalcaliphilus]|uniref:3D domain-containing protein n=1 Tax=Alkalihalobacillus pseudalcaliphilus TaxID=79884 RepID=UPI00069CC73A|nr:3D domain-containing protein [Alkalihalobacillus pseudalcaliphilus]
MTTNLLFAEVTSDVDGYGTGRSSGAEHDTSKHSETVGENGNVRSGDDEGVVLNRESEGWQTFEATAYTADCHGCIGITKSGVDVRDTTHYRGLRVIAVDTAVIPLGSTVEIRYADGTTERATAEDIGGTIRGNKIDILRSSYGKAIEFGRQDVEIRVIDENN